MATHNEQQWQDTYFFVHEATRYWHKAKLGNHCQHIGDYAADKADENKPA